MLREIGAIRQDSQRGLRRWFQDDHFDLYLWQDTAGQPIAFQLCYSRNRNEGALSFSDADGFRHARVDSGEAVPTVSATPILRADSSMPYFRVYSRFLDASKDLEPLARAFVVERLQAYRRVLFGERRVPRRRRPSTSKLTAP